MDPGRAEPSWRSGKDHGFCVTRRDPADCLGTNPVASAFGDPSGATPAGLCEHTMRADTSLSKPELSIWLGIGTFYLAPTQATTESARVGPLTPADNRGTDHEPRETAGNSGADRRGRALVEQASYQRDHAVNTAIEPKSIR
jgi:hypothetical protein